MRKFIRFIILSFIFFLTVPITGLAVTEFKDVPKNHIFYQEINFLFSKNIISGFPEGVFKPERTVTRAEAATIIGRALDLSDEPQDTRFPDVTEKVTGSGFIAAAAERGIITGFPDGTYRPYDPVTRGQMAIFLDRAFQLTDQEHTPAPPFSDISPNMTAYQAIVNAHALGIANGYTDNTFRPATAVTRGQFSAFMTRALKISFETAPVLAIESITGWEQTSTIAEVDVDHEWAITFNDEVDPSGLSQHIYVVRERDNKRLTVIPKIDPSEPKTVRLHLLELYDFDETYNLYVTDDLRSKKEKALAKPLELKFHTSNPEFKHNQTIEQDGIQFDILLAQSNEKLYTKVIAKNISNEDIIYVGFSGCDPGFYVHLLNQTDENMEKTKQNWTNEFSCTPEVPHYQLKSGETIEKAAFIQLSPTADFMETYVSIKLNKLANNGTDSSLQPIELLVPIEK